MSQKEERIVKVHYLRTERFSNRNVNIKVELYEMDMARIDIRVKPAYRYYKRKAQDTVESIMNLNSLILLGVGILIFILPIIPPSWKIIGIIPIAVALLPALTANQKQNEAFNKWKNKVYTEMINCFSQTSKQDEAKEKIKIFLDELVTKIKESIESILDDYGTDIESIKRMNEYLTIKVNETSNKIEEELIDLRMGLETR